MNTFHDYVSKTRELLEKRDDFLMLNEKQKKIWSEFICRVATDTKYQEKLESSPKKILAENGIFIPDDIEVKIVYDEKKVTARDDKEIVLLLPQITRSNLTDDDLDGVVGGSSTSFDFLQKNPGTTKLLELFIISGPTAPSSPDLATPMNG